MALEDLTGTGKFVGALNPAWPVDDDWVNEGDNHIRGIKNVLRNTFPGWNGAQGLFPDGLLAAPGIAFANEPGMGFYRAGASDMRWGVAGADRLIVTSVATTIQGGPNIDFYGSGALRATINSAGRFKAMATGAPLRATSVHEFNAEAAGAYVCDFVNSGTTTPYGINTVLSAVGSGARGTGNYHLNCSDTSGVVAVIFANGGIGNYSANNANLSDERVKNNVSVSPDYTEFVSRLSYKRFSYNEQPNAGPADDLIAQELEALAPELVVDEALNGMKAVLWYQVQQRINSVIPRLIERIEKLELELAAAGAAKNAPD